MKGQSTQSEYGEFLAYVVGLVLILTLSCYWGWC